MAGRPASKRYIVEPAEILPVERVRTEKWTSFELSKHLVETDDVTAIKFLAKRGLIHAFHRCPSCDDLCGLTQYAQGVDGQRWRCRDCNHTKSIRHGSFFAKSHLSLRQMLFFIYFWCQDTPSSFITHELNISRRVVIDFANFCREICVNWIDMNPAHLGGLNDDLTPKVVEVDESKFFHRKYGRGTWHEGHWVFGAVDRENSKNIFLAEVPDRSSHTLIPIIEAHVELGSHIMSDGWRSYRELRNSNMGYLHDFVNHSENFVAPEDPFVHTQTIEGLWTHAKKKLRRISGTNRSLFVSYIREFEWRWRNGGPNWRESVFSKFLASLREQYA